MSYNELSKLRELPMEDDREERERICSGVKGMCDDQHFVDVVG